MLGDQLSLLEEDIPGGVGPRRNIYVGTCSWTDPSLIKVGTFYPKGFSTAEKRLRYYASQFPVVEVDSSYFAMPSAVNSELWVERTPAEFKFNVKAFRLFTGHNTAAEAFPKDLQPFLPPLAARKKSYYYTDMPADLLDELWRRFGEALSPLQAAGKLTAVHFQFAPWVTSTKDRIAHVEHCVERMAGHQVAVEFRNASWLSEDRRANTLAWERGLGVTHVVVDEPAVGNFAHTVWAVTNPNLAILRLHGRNAETWETKGLTASSERFNYDYPEDELADLAERSRMLAEEAFALEVLVNVNYEDQGIKAARAIERILKQYPLRGE